MVKDRNTLVVRRYAEQAYTVLFSPKTGLFARIEDRGAVEPLWAEHGPELMDISITNWCDKGCHCCYRKSTTRGRHMSLDDYGMVMKQAAQMGVLQVALGGGNPNQHPAFSDVLRCTREHGVIPSYTTNGRGLSSDVLDSTARYCGAVAVSAYEPWDEFSEAITRLRSYGVRTNVHFIIDESSIDTAMRWLRDPPGFLVGINALVFLNFKPVTRSPASGGLTRGAGVPAIREFYNRATADGLPFRVGFDSCMVAGLAWHTDVDSTFFEACEAGRFSMFISEDMRAYPCSFMVESWNGVSITESNLLAIWRDHPIFQAVRGKLTGNRCASCSNSSTCMGGCPLFSEINLCEPFAAGDRRGDTVPPDRSLVRITVSARGS